MTPYIVAKPLPPKLLSDATDLILSNPPWRPARVYSTLSDSPGEREDISYRDASVLSRAAAGELYSVFERYVEEHVLHAAISHWGIDELALEGTQLVRYRPGGHFAPHRDADAMFTNRCLTIISYLSEGFEGGETYFPTFKVRVEPKAGRTIVFLSEHLHAGQPVLAGEKHILATWAISRPLIGWI